MDKIARRLLCLDFDKTMVEIALLLDTLCTWVVHVPIEKLRFLSSTSRTCFSHTSSPEHAEHAEHVEGRKVACCNPAKLSSNDLNELVVFRIYSYVVNDDATHSFDKSGDTKLSDPSPIGVTTSC